MRTQYSILSTLICSLLFLATASETALAATGQTPFRKVFIIVLENEDAANALDQPYLRELASRGAYLDNFHAQVHPSQGNYFSLTAGDFLGMHFFWGDWTVTKNVRHIADLIEEKGLTWKAYAEDYPGNCFTGDRGKYRRKHMPFISYKNIQKNPARCAKIVNSDELDKDIAADNVPDFAFYAPNMDNDGHDTNVAFASEWLRSSFDSRLRDPRFMKDQLLIVTFDESQTFTPKNPIYTVLIGDGVAAGSTSSNYYNHYSILRTIEDTLGLGSLNKKDASAASITGIWR